MSTPTADPPDPRSPRPSSAAERDPADSSPSPAPPTTIPTTRNPPPNPLLVGPSPFIQPQPRPNLGSMLFMTAFFFFMSGNNNMPVQELVIGEDGEIVPRVTELDLARGLVDEYRGFINGTAAGNWTEPPDPGVQAWTLIPPRYQHEPAGRSFFSNLTGFYRDATVEPVDLLFPAASASASSHSAPSSSSFFHNVNVPSLNSSSWNETHAASLRGSWDWAHTAEFEMNLKERALSAPNFPEWSWIKGSATLTSKEGGGGEAAAEKTIDYNFYGLHYAPNGTYNLYGLPDGMKIDIRHIPKLYPEEHRNATRAMILGELVKELKVQEEALMLSDARGDESTITTCPLLIYLTVPPIPHGIHPDDLALWEQEQQNPSGLRMSLPRPPAYWEGTGLGGIAIADQCGWAMGISDGTGLRIDDFWRKSINYAAFATASQLLVLLLLVRQMESTRTPSTLAKVSLWTIVIMGITDSWIFSAHVVIGIMSDNRTSLPILVPGFLCLCSAIVFGPRYAVLLHRIQAPERSVPPRPANRPAASPGQTAPNSPATATIEIEEPPSPLERVQTFFAEHQAIRFILGILLFLVLLQLAVLPPLIPIFLFIIYSFWLPQIWRNARRGSSHALDHGFVIGTAVGRLALPLYAFACPDNVFFIKPSSWVWGLVAWQWAQIVLLFAQERFGPAFFLPKSLQPAESYNYHPLLPPSDPENPSSTIEKICSICMEEVDTQPGPSGEVLLGINPRRAYSLAPCGHLFHTKCLGQWLAIKTICPLCKRSLPPL